MLTEQQLLTVASAAVELSDYGAGEDLPRGRARRLADGLNAALLASEGLEAPEVLAMLADSQEQQQAGRW